ncbi:MAG: DUF3313 family protein [Pseudomonadota bacterium]
MTLPNQPTVLLAALFLAACASSPRVQTGPDARVNAQGLHFVDNTDMSEAWFRPDADLTQYNKLMIVSAGTHFVDAEAASDKQRQRYERFEEIMIEEFTLALRELRGFEITDTPGPGVLLLHGAVVNVTLEENNPGPRERVFVNELGSADLVIDLRDSVTGQEIVAARDNGVLESAGGRMTELSDAATSAAARRLAKGWATLLRDRLDTLAGYRLGSADSR